MLNVPHMKESMDPAPSKVCPTCGAYLNPQDEICVSCRTNLKTGEWNMAEPGIEPGWHGNHFLSIAFAVYVAISWILISYILWNQSANIASSSSPEIAKKTESQILRPIPSSQPTMIEQPNIPSPNPSIQDILQSLEKEKNPLVRLIQGQSAIKWLGLKEQEKEKVQQYLILAQNELILFLQSQQGELHQLIQEKRIGEVVTRITPRILSFMQKTCQAFYGDLELDRSWELLRKTYENAVLVGLDAPEVPTTNTTANKLERYTKAFIEVSKQFEQLMQQREYNKAQQQLEHFWQQLQAIEDLDAEAPLTVQVRTRLKEVQSVKALLSIANEGAKMNVGLAKVLFPQSGQALFGNILQYTNGHFYLQNDQGKVIKIALKELQAEEIVFFALNAQKTKHVHAYAGIFYLYERKFSLAQQSFMNALRYGANPDEMQGYLQRTQARAMQEQEAGSK